VNPDELTKRTGALYYKVIWVAALPKQTFLISLLQLDLDDQVALSKRIAIMKLERSFTREDTLTLDAQSTIDFEDKVCDCLANCITSPPPMILCSHTDDRNV
jgi:hypothetical protein